MANGYPDYEGGKRRLYLTPEWAAEFGVDKSFSGLGANQAPGAGISAIYNVPAGKTLYIVSMEIASFATNAADADNNQIVRGRIHDDTAAVWKVAIGGNGGAQSVFSRVIKITAGHMITYDCNNNSNHNCDLWLSVEAYEV